MNRSELRTRRQRRQTLRGRKAGPRRGVLLLVVLSMLVLFLLIGTTFLLTSGQYRTASKNVEQKNRTTFQPADLLERALMQLVRDTNNATSVVRYHSLLRDLYGVEGFVARVHAATPTLPDPNDPSVPIEVSPRYAGVDPTGDVTTAATNFGRGTTDGQIVDLYVLDTEVRSSGGQTTLAEDNAVGLDFDANGLPFEHELSSIDGYYAGCLLTMLDGPCRGNSVRIIDYDRNYRIQTDVSGTPDDPTDDTVEVLGRLRVMAPSRQDGRVLSLGPLLVDANDDGEPETTGRTALADFIRDVEVGHRFIVNGRPFNGTGVGYNPLALSSDRTDAPTARLSALQAMLMPDGTFVGMEHALAPHAAFYTQVENATLNPASGVNPWGAGAAFLPLTQAFAAPTAADTVSLYRTFAGPGDTDESYDAPDTQNMALASQALEPRTRGRVVDAAGNPLDPDAYYATTGAAAPAYLDLEGVTIPSFHRPALANFWFHRLLRSSWLSGISLNDRARAILEPFDADGDEQHGLSNAQARQIAAIKRKFLLRPLREDHPDFDGSNPLSRYSSTALRTALNSGQLVNTKDASDAGDDEITFPFWEAVGPWDVDNDGDGVNDSVWVDIGLPVQQTEDGRWYKPLAAMLVEDLDGRLNLNAHGSESDLVSNSLDASFVDANNDGIIDDAERRYANLAMDASRLGQAINDAESTGGFPVLQSWLRSSDQLPTGSGWGTAEVSLRPILSPTLPVDEAFRGAAGFAGNTQYDDYARILGGRPSPQAGGRTTAAPLSVAVTFGRYGSQPGSVATLNLTRPGRTFQEALPAIRDPRTPLEFLGYPAYTGASDGGLNEGLSGFSSPLDLRGQYASGLSGVGSAVDEPGYVANSFGASWRDLPETAPDDSPYELDLSTAARRLAPASVEAVRDSYATGIPLVDDAPFSAAELERILRAFDSDAEGLPDRLWEAVDAFDPTKLAAQRRVNNAINTGGNPDTAQNNPNTLENAVASARAAINRRQVTTDSFDLPVPNENWADRLALGADGRPGVPEFDTIGDWVVLPENRLDANDDGDFGIGEPGVDDDGDGTIDENDDVEMFDEGDEAVVGYDEATQQHTFADGTTRTYDDLFNAGCDDYVVIMRQDPPQPGRLTDFLKYRVTLELLRKGTITFAQILSDRALVDQIANNVLYGAELSTTDPRRSTASFTFGGMLAPEVLAGRRMDLNRPFGDGRDNNGNGVVDEPQEAGEPYTYTINGVGELVVAAAGDLNNDGRLDQDAGDAGDPGHGVLYSDSDGDGFPDSFDANDLADRDRNRDQVLDGSLEPIVDNLWFDDGAGTNSGNGIRDLDEFRPFVHTPTSDANGRGSFVDTNNNGVRDGNEPIVHDDSQMARQLFARHLYCLMLALVDENYLAPYDSDDPQVLHYLDPLSGINRGSSDPDAESGEAYRIAHDLFQIEFDDEITAGDVLLNHTVALGDPAQETLRLIILNRARQIAQRKLTRRTIAQWAINVVDFRDPDSIQTPFEYDENPWDGWNVVDRVNGNAVYPIDGDLTTNENLAMVRPVTNAGFEAPDYDIPRPTFEDRAEAAKRWMQRLDQTRGVVWGAERPEVLLTEGVAWHDRRVEDESVAEPQESDQGTEGDGGTLNPNDGDDDLDQFRKPKGFAYVEAHNPHVGDDQRPAELYSHVARDSDIDQTGAAATPSAGVRLDRLSNVPADRSGDVARRVTRSPVWRIACVEEHPLIRNTTVADPDLVNGLALDDPPTNAGTATAQPQQYLGNTLYGGQWLYQTDRSRGGASSLSFQGLEFRELPEAYLDFHERKRSEAEYALATPGSGIIGASNLDADGLVSPLGVIETSPTVPDTSFPSFDRFAQPSEPQQVTVDISSKVDAASAGNVQRGVNRKPTTYYERVFYMAAGLPARVNETPSTQDKIAVPAPGLIVPINPVEGDGFAPDNSPGLRVPRLTYTINGRTSNVTRANIFGATVGFEATAEEQFTIHVSKFATAYDRFNLDADVHVPEASPLQEPLRLQQGLPNNTETIEFAPLLPGRRAVIGTTGDVYNIGEPTDDTSPNYRDQEQVIGGVYHPSFTRADAGKVADRYAALLSGSPASESEDQFSDVLRDVPDDAEFSSAGPAQLRRIEMIPDSNPNRHQFMIRMNGLSESTLVQQGGTPFNLTSVDAAGARALDSPGEANRPESSAGSPVIAIPIHHFSISEPLDEYLVRQIELDPALGKRPVYAHEDTGRLASEEHFQEGDTPGGDKGIFDEPFDIAPELVENQTTPNYRSLHLERLANPLLPWNPPPTRPDGTLVEQHLADLPVNPYLPVDARSLDLTAFNSISTDEANVNDGTGSKYVNPITAAFGPEARHRRPRSFNGNNGVFNTSDPLQRTLIGFISNERGRPLGVFPLLWLTEPARLLWRQGGAATFSELAHTYNKDARNGYIAEREDQIVGVDAFSTTDRQDLLRFDIDELGAPYDSVQYIQVPWRWTLGFSDWAFGKFYTANSLSWFDGTASPDLVQQVDLDSDLVAGDLIGQPEISDAPELVGYVNPAADLGSNGRPDIVETFSVETKPDARGFFEQYLDTLVQDNSTTPELAWPNRPFASAGELMQVPVWGGSRMLTHFSVFNWLHTLNPSFDHATQVNPYNGEWAVFHDGLDYNPSDGPTRATMGRIDGDFTNDGTRIDNDGFPDDGSTNTLRFRETLGHFGHLINFFQTARFPSFVGAFTRQGPSPDGGLETQEYVVPRGASHFYRLMDYVHVPSRYTATASLLSPNVFAETGLPIGDARTGLSAPFNRVDSYREPGRVNLNTVVGRRDANELTRLNPANGTAAGATVPRLPDYWSEVYDGLMQRTQDGSLIDYASSTLLKAGHLGPAWRDVALSRRGYVQPGFDPTVDPTDGSFGLATARQNQVDYSPRRMHPDFPTLYANPFRAPGEGANVPLDHMVQTGVDATLLRAHPLSPGADGAWGRRGVDDLAVDKSSIADGVADGDLNRDDANEAGVLPIELGIGSANVPGLQPIDRISADVVLTRFSEQGTARRGALPDTFLEDAFREARIDTPAASSINPRDVSAAQSLSNEIYNAEISKRATPVALFSGASTEPSLDTERNATMRYLPIQRMSSLTTTRSNVYAVWITIGFFEVKPVREDQRIWPRYLADTDSDGDGDTFQSVELEALFNKVYPGGWTLGQEIGIDTGEDRRHRGFYMVDRSRPVAFKPGEDANVSDAILLRRRIQ